MYHDNSIGAIKLTVSVVGLILHYHDVSIDIIAHHTMPINVFFFIEAFSCLKYLDLNVVLSSISFS